MGLLAELKRRNVFRVAVAYLVLGWVVTQITATMAPALRLPEWTVSLVVWIGVVGFPFVLLFSWIYELAPEGLKREREIDQADSITHVTGRRLDTIVIGLLLVAMLLFAFQQFGPDRRGHAAPGGVAPPAATPALPARIVPPAEENSIAVLPFINMSSDPEQEYFSDGLSEELLNLLAEIPELRVIARTSSFAFKGKDVDIETVAKKLHVAHVLEGSVRKSGDRVRITAQLIRAGNSSHLWSESWDRKLDDIFAIQDEIAAAVVEKLKLELLGAAPKARAIDAGAYSSYLQGREMLRQGSVEGYAQSLILFQQATAQDPGYAAAWASQAEAYQREINYGVRPVDEGFRLARAAAGKALAIDPAFGPAHADLGRIAMTYDGNLAAAAEHFKQALALAPDNADVLRGASLLSMSLGRLDQAIALQEYSVSLDPVGARGINMLGNHFRYSGNPDAAIATYRTAVALSPAIVGPRFGIGMAQLDKGDATAALASVQQEPAAGGWAEVGLPMVYHALGRKAESDAALKDLIEKQELESAYNIAYVLAYRGEADRAFEWLDKAVAYRDTGLAEIVNQPLFDNIRDDPRWLPFLRKLGKAPEQLAAIEFDVRPPAHVGDRQ